MNILKKLAKAIKLNEDMIKKIFIEDHLIKNFSKNYKKIEVDIQYDSMMYIRKLAKKLKVSEDAVIVTGLKNYLDREKKLKQK